MSKPETIGSLLRDARRALTAAPFRPPRREASLLLGYVLELGEGTVLAHDERPVPGDAADRFRALLARRLEGEPVAYLIGEREFFGRSFAVDSRVLIPRPETEHLVEAALTLDLPERPWILDVGTGSGCLAVTLALEKPGARVVATDLSLDALRVAVSNVHRHQAGDRVRLVRADLTEAFRLGAFDLVVSNPPYVDTEDPATSPEVRGFEPPLALFARNGGKAVLEALLDAAPTLHPDAYLVMEIGYDQSRWLRSTVAVRSGLGLIDVARDYSDIPRIAILRARS